VPYDMEENKETIVMGMQLDYTGKDKLEKPLYPDEDPAVCEALPILWVYNNKCQLAAWNIFYLPGMKSGKRAMAMTSIDAVDQDWRAKREEIKQNVRRMTQEEKRDRLSWEELWIKAFPETKRAKSSAPSPETNPQKVDSKPPTPVTPSALNPTPAIPPAPLGSLTAPSQPVYGQPSQLGASTTLHGPSSLGGATPGQSGLYTGFGAGLNAGRQGHVFGEYYSWWICSSRELGRRWLR